jgi:hypothetical protein
VPAGIFAEDQLERLRTFPGIGRDDLIRYLTLMPADVAFLDPGRGGGRLTGSGLPLRRDVAVAGVRAPPANNTLLAPRRL